MADPALRHRDHTGTDHYVAAHEVLPPAPDWVLAARDRALGRLREHGFPGSKDEDWKYTSAKPILKVPFTPALGARTAIFGRFLDPAAPRLVLVDGQVQDAGFSMAGRASITSLRQAMGSDSTLEGLLGTALGDEPLGFEALNTAFLVDGVSIDVPDGVRLEKPIHLVHTHTGGQRMATLRHLIRVGRGAAVTVVEHFLGHGEGLTSAITEIVAGDGAQVRHIRLQEEHQAAFHVATLAARVGRDASLTSHALTLGGRLSRFDVRVRLEAPGASCDLRGLYLLKGEQHADHHTHVDHAAPRTTSRELYKGIVDGQAHGVFTGRVVVRPDAQHIDAVQDNHNLLLGDRAVVNSRPQLEIHADDVKCAHGATIGRMDPEARFYLQQRGLDAAESQALLTWAFANEIVAALPEGPMRQSIDKRVWRWLGKEAA